MPPYISTYTQCMNTHHWLNPAFAVAEGYLANRMMVHRLVPVLYIHSDDSKSPKYSTLFTSTNSNTDSKSIGAGMDISAILLAVTIVTFIVHLVMSLTMIATMVLIIRM